MVPPDGPDVVPVDGVDGHEGLLSVVLPLPVGTVGGGQDQSFAHHPAPLRRHHLDAGQQGGIGVVVRDQLSGWAGAGG